MSEQIPYPAEHSQACFGMHSGGCVCPLGNREARLRHEAPAMEVLLRLLCVAGVDLLAGNTSAVSAILDVAREAGKLVKSLDDPPVRA